ncbi:hypothetical protein JVU11DRAFT_9808 [Chiua virens]|nr:hypothetical protein JVU11DRAFT_9808 [Chiua virens]
MWDIVDKDMAERREAELKRDFWRELLQGAATAFRFDNHPRSAQNIIDHLLNTDDQLPDFSARCESRSSSLKYVSRCKEARKIRLERTERLQDEETHIKFFVAEGSQYQPSQSTVLKEFAKLVSDLACVFDLNAPATCCYIFWKDTDLDLMAFNKDQRYIFFNLAYYKRNFHDKRVDKEKAAIEWFLIMAHEMAHNIAVDHDEYHGALAARIAVAYFPAFRERFHF